VRVVSLVPSSTETLLALGIEPVACTRFCEQPGITHVGGTKNPAIGEIVALAPDLVVLDREENRLEDAAALARHGLALFVSDVRSVEDAVAVVADLARAVGATSMPVDPGVSELAGPSTSVLVPIWRRPWMTIGRDTYGASVLRRLGFDASGWTGDGWGSGDYPTFSLEQLTGRHPEVIAVPSEPYDFTDAHLDELRAAAPDRRIVRVDGRDLFWWGARTPGALRRLAAALSA
jgi:ABC-type Fe3+-hydroxamate transport system substrate-binding protein